MGANIAEATGPILISRSGGLCLLRSASVDPRNVSSWRCAPRRGDRVGFRRRSAIETDCAHISVPRDSTTNAPFRPPRRSAPVGIAPVNRLSHAVRTGGGRWRSIQSAAGCAARPAAPDRLQGSLGAGLGWYLKVADASLTAKTPGGPETVHPGGTMSARRWDHRP